MRDAASQQHRRRYPPGRLDSCVDQRDGLGFPFDGPQSALGRCRQLWRCPINAETMRRVNSAARRGARRGRSALVAKVGLAAWFFGNVYEGAVGLAQLLAYAQRDRPAGLLTAGSPARYFAPLAPPALVSTVISLAQDWRAGEDRRIVAARATSFIGALALSGYLIPFVNVPLLAAGRSLSDLEWAELCARWHQVNAVRVVLVGVALALQPSR